MKFGIVIPGGEDFRAVAELAADAEEGGWDGLFVPDGIAILNVPMFDPWVMLAAMAMRTERIRLGTLITPVSRRRPWKLARETVTLDHLSRGRLILCVGLGAAADDGGFSKVGEAMDMKVRAKRLDEGLAILDGLWSGKSFSFFGEHYRIDNMRMPPRPVQSPRIPVWVVGVWPKAKSMNRAVQWDGIIPQRHKNPQRFGPEDIRAVRDFVDKNRTNKTPFDIICGGPLPKKSAKKAAGIIRSYEEAGGTWWLEEPWGVSSFEKLREIIRGGPPGSGRE